MIAISITTHNHSPLPWGECHLTGKTYQALARARCAVLPVKWSALALERHLADTNELVLPVKRTIDTNGLSIPRMTVTKGSTVLPVKCLDAASRNEVLMSVLPVKHPLSAPPEITANEEKSAPSGALLFCGVEIRRSSDG